MPRNCPYCNEETFGWRDLITLGPFALAECKNCHNLVRNSGWRQLIAPLIFISIFLATLPLWKFIPSETSVLLIPVAVIVLGMVLVLTAKPVKTELPQADLSPFTPDPNNDKAILIQGWNEDELREILNDFVEQDLSAFVAFRIEIQQRFENSFALTFPEDIHPDEFVSLINYLGYPIGFGLAGRSIIVAGQTTLNSDFDGLPKSVEGEKALLYLLENDEDHDVVYLQTESGVTLAKSLNERVWRRVKDARLSIAVESLVSEESPPYDRTASPAE
jgi:hypothetical protein